MSDTISAQPNLGLLGNFASFDERIKHERKFRIQNAENRLSFGVTFLDDSLGGIYPNDLILLGAKTGFGKSQLAVLIALHNARQGKKVHFFALEAEEYEIERRVKYQRICDSFFALEKRPNIKLNYLDWYYGNFDQELAEIEDEIDALGSWIPDLKVFYRTQDFNAAELERLILGVKSETDLIIIDHLHYIDHDDENENRALKSIVKKVRDCALLSAKPIILIAHVRKADKRMKQLIPDIEDFHGSSDIGKIATKAITIAPDFGEQQKNHRGTYMQVLKCRPDGTRTHAVALTAYNFTSQRYEPEYYLGKLTPDSTEFEMMEQRNMPFWAKRGKGNL